MPKILVVEDDPSLNMALKDKLEMHGYAVSSATNGKEGLGRLDQEDFDLIIMDIMMPEMDGIEMIYHSNQKRDKIIPTIILTNLSETAFPENITEIMIKSNVTLNQIIEEVGKKLAFRVESD